MSVVKDLLDEISTLQYHDELNPILWQSPDSLKPEVRDKLLMFADRFASYTGVPHDQIKDVVMTGGNANYDYTPASDIDVHLMVDTSQLGPAIGFRDYLMAKKANWMSAHDPRVKGYPLEPYVQDISEFNPAGRAMYSIRNGMWIDPPVKGAYDFSKDADLAMKVDSYKQQIDAVTCGDCDAGVANDLFKRIVDLRRSSLTASGEYALGNLIFKELRNSGYIGKLRSFIDKQSDLGLSL